MKIDGTATHQPDGSRTADATVTVLTPGGRFTSFTGYLCGDQSGEHQLDADDRDPVQVGFGRSMLFGNRYHEVQRWHDPPCGCVHVPAIEDITGKVTLPGSGCRELVICGLQELFSRSSAVSCGLAS
jgi:hypothetical protein